MSNGEIFSSAIAVRGHWRKQIKKGSMHSTASTWKKNTKHKISNNHITQISAQEEQGRIYLPWHFRTEMATHFKKRSWNSCQHGYGRIFFFKCGATFRGRSIPKKKTLQHTEWTDWSKIAGHLHLFMEIANDRERWQDFTQELFSIIRFLMTFNPVLSIQVVHGNLPFSQP